MGNKINDLSKKAVGKSPKCKEEANRDWYYNIDSPTN